MVWAAGRCWIQKIMAAQKILLSGHMIFFLMRLAADAILSSMPAHESFDCRLGRNRRQVKGPSIPEIKTSVSTVMGRLLLLLERLISLHSLLQQPRNREAAVTLGSTSSWAASHIVQPDRKWKRKSILTVGKIWLDVILAAEDVDLCDLAAKKVVHAGT